ncbi:integrase arm-type DNA-binding domain-containing protein [Sulfurimonas sp. HSL-1656]|uniref:tyrosine-type recombinase/integrase n=1 Tax=Thiomicrolovo subterrani TaxID=3131934 RepID=UPI0031F7C7DE
MAKPVTPLTDRKIRNTKPTEAQQRLSDGDGLYIIIKPTGSKLWRFDYTLGGKRNTVSLGKYPDVSLARARELRTQYREMVAAGTSPVEKKVEVQKHTVDDAAADFFARLEREVGEKYYHKLKQRYDRYIGSTIGRMDLDEVEPSDIVRMIQGVGEFWETAKRIHGISARIFTLAVTTGKARRNPVNDIDVSVLVGKMQTSHYAHVTDPRELGAILNVIDEYRGDASTAKALRILPHVFVRPANIRFMEWDELDLKAGTWKIPKEKMKMKRPHIVPLSRQVVAMLKELGEPQGRYVFNSPFSKNSPLSENTLNYAMKRMGFKDVQTAHGFRHTAATLLAEHMYEIGINSDVIEAQMAHEKGGVRGIYNHAQHLKERTVMMQWWSDFLDALKLQ